MATQGTATLDFGAFPGASDTSVAVTGQAGIVAGSLVEAWIRPETNADPTDNEHMVETIKVVAASIVAGTGFTIYGFNTSQMNEPAQPDPGNAGVLVSSATAIAWRPPTTPGGRTRGGGSGTRI